MKNAKHKVPVEMKHILTGLGVPSVDTDTVEAQMRQRAAMQVQDYLEVMHRKISQFQGAELSRPVHDTMRMLQTHTRNAALHSTNTNSSTTPTTSTPATTSASMSTSPRENSSSKIVSMAASARTDGRGRHLR